MKIKILAMAVIIMFTTSCKKVCQEQGYGDIVFYNKTSQPLKIKMNNSIPTGCLSDNNGFLFAGSDCTAQATAGIQHSVTVLTAGNTVYWQFETSIGACGTRIIHIK